MRAEARDRPPVTDPQGDRSTGETKTLTRATRNRVTLDRARRADAPV